MSDILEKLLKKRGLKKPDEIEKFLNPKWEDNYDPFLFSDMEKIVERIWLAVEKKEKILIFSDYDTDGIPGGALMAEFFKKIKYQNFSNFIPNRNNDGYGLPAQMAERVINEFEPNLIITVDCGITDVEGTQVCKKSGVDLIITDHHLPNGKLPEAVGILDHKVPGEKYPEQVLSGAGIAFKLIQALLSKKPASVEITDEWEKWLLDLVAIATVCDMVPLVGENRTLVKYGQLVLNKTQRPGLKQIIKNARVDGKNLSTEDIGFMIGPRLNSAARLADPMVASTALAGEKNEAVASANDLEKLNNRRKYLTASVMKKVWKELGARSESEVIVIGNKDWPLGMVGLIAGKIADKYKKPAFVWTEAGGVLKGSCRSGGEYSVFDLITQTKDEFLQFGGHDQSGGFSVSFDKIHTLEEKLSKNLTKTKKINCQEALPPDMEIGLDEVNMENYREINKMAPFGVDNPQPVFLIKQIMVAQVNYFGKHQEHLELIFNDIQQRRIKAIAFYYADNFEQDFHAGQIVDLTCSMELNTWNGNSELRLKILAFS